MGAKTVSTGSPKINQLSIQSSSLGVTIPRGWGTGRVKCNLLWYGGFRAVSVSSKQKGKGAAPTSTTYNYSASMILGVSTGPVRGIRSVYRDKEVFSGSSALAQAGLSLAVGTPDQAPWGYLSSLFPDQALGYSRTAYVYASDYPLTDSATLRNHSFEVQFPTHVSSLDDANPRDIATELLTDPVHGVKGWTTSMIGDMNDWGNYCLASDLLLSLVLDQQKPAAEALSELGQATNTEIFWSEGQLKAVPYGDTEVTGNGVTWTPNLTPVYDLTEDDFHTEGDGSPVSVEIVDQSDAYNIIQIEYLDRANQYNTAIQPAPDLDNIIQFGERKKDPVSLHSICRSSVASTVAQLLLARTLYRREKYKFRLPWNFVLLEPMDYVTLTTTTDELRLDRVLVQIESIDEDDEDGILEIVAEGVSSGSAAAATYNSHSGSGYSQNTSQDPGSVVSPVLLNAPISLTGGEPEIWMAAGSVNPAWGGCEIWISADDTSYRLAGILNGSSRYGLTTTSLASHPDPDPTGSVGVDMTPTDAVLLSGSAADLSVAATLCSIGSELVAYQDAALTAPGVYTLSGLRRGLYGTAPQAHLSGAPLVRIDDGIFRLSYGDMAVGSTLYVKFASFNVWGQALQDISSLSPYTLDLLPQFTTSTGALANYTLVPSSGMYVSGQRVRKVNGSDGAWDQGVSSAESYTGGAAVSFRPSQTDAHIIVGLNSDPLSNDSWETIDYGLFCVGNGTLEVVESGSVISLGGQPYALGDTLGVVYDGSTVVYTKNGVVLRTVSAASNLRFYLDSTFLHLGGEVQNITFTSVGRVGAPGSPGAAGDPGYSPPALLLTRRSIQLQAYADGSIKSLADANGRVTVQQSGGDVTGSTTFTVDAVNCTFEFNNSANTPIAGQPKGYFRVTGVSSETARITINATIGGTVLTEVVSVFTVIGGSEIVNTLPTTNLFEGRRVYLLSSGTEFKYKSGGWVPVTAASEIVGEVQGSQLANGAVGVNKLAVGLGSNLLLGAVPGTNPQRYLFPAWNPDNASFRNFSTGTDVNNSGSGLVREIIADPNSNWPAWLDPWRMGDNSNFAVYQTSNGTPNYGVTDFLFDRVITNAGATEGRYPIEPLKYYEGGVYVGPHRCKVWVFLLWYDASMNQISPTDIVDYGPAFIDQSSGGSMGGKELSNYTRLVARGQAPSNARFVALVMRKSATITGGDSFVFGTRPMLAETVPNATQMLPYSPPPPGLFHAESLISNTVDTRHLRANSVEAGNIKAGAVVASKMAIGEFDNLLLNGNLSSGTLDGWTRRIVNAAGGDVRAAGPETTGSWPSRFAIYFYRPANAGGEISVTNGNTSFDDVSKSEGIDLQPGDELWFEAAAWTSGASTAAHIDCVARLSGSSIAVLPATALANCTGGSVLAAANGPSAVRFSGYFKNTTGVAVKAYIRAQHGSINTFNSEVFLWNMKTTRRNKGELIVDGAIQTNHIEAGSVTASKMNVTQLSAITADVGDLTAGLIRSADNTYRIDVTNGRTIVQNGGYMKVTGKPFGSSFQFIEWYGPYNANLATCTESNAVYYLKTNGSAYFGGTLSAGIIRNSTQNTVVNPTAIAELGPFGSNGGVRTVVVSLQFQAIYTISNAASYSGSTSATVVLERWTGSAWAQFGSFTATGNVVVAEDGFGTSEPGSIRIEMSGSTTATDTSGGLTGIRLRARLITWSDHSISSSVMGTLLSQTLGLISTEG